jgi:hypothetical protein
MSLHDRYATRREICRDILHLQPTATGQENYLADFITLNPMARGLRQSDRLVSKKGLRMKFRILAIGALAMLAASAANATVYFDNTTMPSAGVDGPLADTTTILGASFAAGAANFSSINLLLSASNHSDGGSATVYLVSDNGSGRVGTFGIPTIENGSHLFTSFSGAQNIGTILDASLSASLSLVSLGVSPTVSTLDQEYWLVLAPSAGSSFQWSFDGNNAGTGIANQGFFNNNGGPDLTPSDNISGAYQFSVETPEPASLAILGGGIAALGIFRRRRPNTAKIGQL